MTVHKKNWPVFCLCLMMVLVPALGAPNELLLQDTLKSIQVSFFALAASFIFFRYRCERNVPMYFHGLLCLPLGLMAYALDSMAWSHTYLGGVEAIRWFVFSLIFFLGLNTLTPVRVTLLAWSIHTGAVLASLWAALQFWSDFSLFTQGPNPASTFINRNFFAEFIVCTLPFSALLLTRVKDKISVFLLTFSLGFNIVALMMTGTRSALLGLFVLAALLPGIVLLYRKQMASTGWRMGHCIALTAFLITTIWGIGSITTLNPKLIAESGQGNAIDRAFSRVMLMTQPSEYQHGSISIRYSMWATTGRMIRANPVMGVGAGAWEVQAPLYQEKDSVIETDYYAHNEILQLIAEYGLAGWLFLLCLIAYLLWAAYRTCVNQTNKGQREAPLRAFTLSSLLVLLLVSNAGFPWRLATTGALFALNLSILAASDRRVNAENRFSWHVQQWEKCYSRWALLATTLFAALAIYIAQQAIACEASLIHGIQIALAIARSGDPHAPRWEKEKVEMLHLMRKGIAINPHYRKLTPLAADAMASWGDWKNATWIWESILESRPNVVLFLANIARGHMQAGNFSKAQEYLSRAQKIQPTEPTLAVLEVILWSKTGREQAAALRAKELLSSGMIDRDLLQVAYFLSLRNKDPELAIQALELGIKKWPAKAVDGWLKLGNLYNSTEAKDEQKALAAYQAALDAAPTPYKAIVWAKIPPAYQNRLQQPSKMTAEDIFGARDGRSASSLRK